MKSEKKRMPMDPHRATDFKGEWRDDCPDSSSGDLSERLHFNQVTLAILNGAELRELVVLFKEKAKEQLHLAARLKEKKKVGISILKIAVFTSYCHWLADKNNVKKPETHLKD